MIHDVPVCYVYYITDGLRVKVGIAKNVAKRVKALQTGNGGKLEIVHTIPFSSRALAFKKEASLHKMYSSYRMHGEWFSLNVLRNLPDIKET